uniref:Uncharacterized protein n=1 Tax=Vespula pensylvanica TaxID=30213 RepID=A0A834P6T0_VESPE|nr:hypothetical protein H0235_004246 [Vespula pensylvanica]
MQYVQNLLYNGMPSENSILCFILYMMNHRAGDENDDDDDNDNDDDDDDDDEDNEDDDEEDEDDEDDFARRQVGI